MRKKILLLAILFSLAENLFSQQQTFDITTYTLPKGWKKQPAESAIQFTKEDETKGIYCLMTLYKAVPGTSGSKENFDLAWSSLVKEMVTVSTPPEMQPSATENGWETQSGYAAFESDGNKGVVVLVTSSGFEKMVNLIILTNTDVYEKEMSSFLESISLKKPAVTTEQIKTSVATEDKNTILGTWAKTGSVNPDYHDAYATSIAGYTKDQYSFNSNGTYHFVSKTFGMSLPKILLVKESGIYQINGNNITITPQKAVIEAWSKKDGGDKWGKLLTKQNRTLEKVTYQFTKHYFSGIQLWNVVLQSNKVTQRDGPFSNNKTFANAWYYSPISSNNPVIELPGGQQIVTEEPAQQVASNSNTAILGSWGVGTTIASSYNMRINEGSIITQYTFNADGTYGFYIKTFRYQLDKLLLTRETGTYQISGNQLSIHPQKSVIEAWSKKDGTDNWGNLISSQKKELEKATYYFSTENFGSGMVLILKGQPTKRDGYYNNSNKDAWFYPAKSNVELIKLPD